MEENNKKLKSLSQTEGQISFVQLIDSGDSSLRLSDGTKAFLKLETNLIKSEQFFQFVHPDDRLFLRSLRALEMSLYSEPRIDLSSKLWYSFRILIEGRPRFVCCTDKVNKGDNLMTSVLQDLTFLDFTGRLSFFWSSTSISFSEFKRRLKQKMRFNLTEQEIRIIRMIKDGRAYTEISDKLFISISTVKKHLNNIYTKCNCKNSRELLNYSEKYYTFIFT
jgi:DNA-binding CsgD family transcriptional regulator